MEYVLSDLRDQVMTMHGGHRPLLIAGGGTKSFYGNPWPAGAPHGRLDMTAYHGVASYQPSELVVTARAGTPLAELESMLAAEGQMLAFEPPHFGAGATVGGCVASGLAGPRRMAAGGVRDFVLGATLLDADGRILRFGGEVMKNVAGYDVSRLLAGSLGIFGVILEVSLKVSPRPLCERTRRLAMGEAQALALFGRWRASPLPVSASAWVQDKDSGCVWVRLSGSEPAVAAAAAGIGGDAVDDAEAAAFWLSLREQTHPFFAGWREDEACVGAADPLWRLAVRPVAPPLGLGPALIEWGGGQRWIAGGGLTADQVRQAAAAAGGHATLFRRGRDAQAPADGVFHPLAPGNAAITRALKAEFDVSGVFNPGRMIVGL